MASRSGITSGQSAERVYTGTGTTHCTKTWPKCAPGLNRDTLFFHCVPLHSPWAHLPGLTGDILAPYSSLRRLEPGEGWPLHPSSSDRMRADGFKLLQERVRLDIRRNFVLEWVPKAQLGVGSGSVGTCLSPAGTCGPCAISEPPAQSLADMRCPAVICQTWENIMGTWKKALLLIDVCIDANCCTAF